MTSGATTHLDFNGKENLVEFLSKAISDTLGKIVFQAGHFATVHCAKTGELIPAIAEDIQEPDQKSEITNNPYMGTFPGKTWDLGLQLLTAARQESKEAKIALIVNDWQWVNRADHGQPNIHRQKFYTQNELPKLYLDTLKKADLDDSILFRNNITQDSYYFSETKLRKMYGATEKMLSCPTMCAYEYIPFLGSLMEADTRLLISFIPIACKEFIIFGTRTVMEETKKPFKVINIFLNGDASKDIFGDITAALDQSV